MVFCGVFVFGGNKVFCAVMGEFCMITYPRIDPVLLAWGPLKVHWYGVMYLCGFAAAYLLGRRRARQAHSPVREAELSDLVFYGALGVVLGGRLGYVLFYQTAALWRDPTFILRVWQGGMSFHGGLLGVMAAMAIYARQHHVRWLALMDFAAPLVPIGLAAGRLGNFINGELWGRITTVPWGMVFPGAGPLPRHPSQLYELFLEGVLLFAILWWYSRKARPIPSVSALFLIIYGLVRMLVECFRVPDPQLGVGDHGSIVVGTDGGGRRHHFYTSV
jgi:phosphatidylglycerol:prolipoprotein diacylglycerol transferase